MKNLRRKIINLKIHVVPRTVRVLGYGKVLITLFIYICHIHTNTIMSKRGRKPGRQIRKESDKYIEEHTDTRRH